MQTIAWFSVFADCLHRVIFNCHSLYRWNRNPCATWKKFIAECLTTIKARLQLDNKSVALDNIMKVANTMYRVLDEQQIAVYDVWGPPTAANEGSSGVDGMRQSFASAAAATTASASQVAAAWMACRSLLHPPLPPLPPALLG